MSYVLKSPVGSGVGGGGLQEAPWVLHLIFLWARLRVTSSLFYFHHSTCQEWKGAPLLAC